MLEERLVKVIFEPIFGSVWCDSIEIQWPSPDELPSQPEALAEYAHNSEPLAEAIWKNIQHDLPYWMHCDDFEWTILRLEAQAPNPAYHGPSCLFGDPPPERITVEWQHSRELLHAYG